MHRETIVSTFIFPFRMILQADKIDLPDRAFQLQVKPRGPA
jgi:hypothetical protein